MLKEYKAISFEVANDSKMWRFKWLEKYPADVCPPKSLPSIIRIFVSIRLDVMNPMISTPDQCTILYCGRAKE